MMRKKMIEINEKRFRTVEEAKRWEAAEEVRLAAEYEKWRKSLPAEEPAYCDGCQEEVDEVGCDGLCEYCRNYAL
jgi:hypothetical protein